MYRKPTKLKDLNTCTALSFEVDAPFCDYSLFSNAKDGDARRLNRHKNNEFDLTIISFWDDILKSTKESAPLSDVVVAGTPTVIATSRSRADTRA